MSTHLLPGPWRLTLVTNPDDCNLSCDMCPTGALPPAVRPRRMDPALALSVLEERSGSPLRQVIPSTRGEPLLWAGMDTLLAACERHRLRVNLTTNGTFPGRGPEAWGQALLPLATDVKISWNGARPATAERIMAGLSFAAALEALRRFLLVRDGVAASTGWRATVSFQVTVQEGNVEELPELVRLAALLGVDRVKLNHVQPWLPYLAARSLRRTAAAIARFNAAAAGALASAAETPRTGGGRVLVENGAPLAPDPASPAPRGPCRFAGREAFIHWDGQLSPCPHPLASRGELGQFGSVGHTTLGELWAAPAFADFVAGVPQHPVCASCPFRRPGGA
ncbi:MAG TPA: radical SAM protein [Anaeromyxobacter sp.]|nr:radical SAM protein [Anaeromyxobacter sp.]